MRTASVYYGDCLKHLTHWNNWNQWREVGREEAVRRMLTDRKLADLIYLDPPWNSDTYYNITYESADNKAKGNTAQSTVFTDVWEWGDAAEERLTRLTKEYLSPNDPFYPLLRARDCIDGLAKILGRHSMLAYLTYMAERLAFCRELLEDTGSIYLHCDPTAGHYLKTLMDAIFGKENYRNDIVWCYGKWSNKANCFQRNHEYIFFYSKSDKAKFNVLREFSDDKIRKMEKGWITNTVRSAKSPTGRIRQLIVYDRAKAASAIEKGNYDNVVYTEGEGSPMRSWWPIPHLNSQAKERRGYRTQKPLKLLKRIIEASTNKGDVVLDPFCGCGPAVVAAHQLKRQFVGIDISLFTVQSVVRVWLTEIGLGNIRIAGIPEDLASARKLAIDDPFEFETFAIELCHPAFVANKEQRKDGGVDGKGVLLQPVKENGKWKNIVLVQVKGGKNPPSLDKVSRFARDIEKTEGVICGVFITVEEKHWTREMKKIAREMGKWKHPGTGRKYPKLQHWWIQKADLRAKEETLFEGLPNLPELMGLDKKALIPRQADFNYWHPTQEEE